MATQLVDEMSGKWNPDDFKDEFREQVMALVEHKRDAGDTETVLQPEESAPESAEVIDLTALLQRSLGAKGGAKTAGKSQTATKKPAAKVAATKPKAPAKSAPKQAGKSGEKKGSDSAAPKRKAA
jgi:DNA end-binding protein Ku